MYEEKTSVSSSNQTTLIHKALKKLMNGAAVRPTVVPEDADEQQMLTVDNNNEDMTETDNGHGGGADPEEEEEALSESEIPMSGVDFQTMYRSFMSGSVSEDSDGSKDVMAGSQEDGQPLNINFGDANSPLRYLSSLKDVILEICRLQSLSFQRRQEDVSVLLSAAVLARALPPHPRHAQGEVRHAGHVQVLPQDLQKQELPRLPHLEVPQARQGADRSSGPLAHPRRRPQSQPHGEVGAPDRQLI